jgi:hypothetical protein
MIVIMMNANHILARLSSLKNEMSDLRVANARYCNRKGYTALEKSASALRRDRLVEDQTGISGPDETLCLIPLAASYFMVAKRTLTA